MRKGSFFSKPRKISISEYSNKNTSIRDEDLFKTKINFAENNRLKVPKLILNKDNYSTTTLNSFRHELRDFTTNNKTKEIEEREEFATSRAKTKRSQVSNNSVLSRYFEEIKKKRYENELTYRKIKRKGVESQNHKGNKTEDKDKIIKPKKKDTSQLDLRYKKAPSELQDHASISPIKLERLNSMKLDNKASTVFGFNRMVSLNIPSTNDLVTKILKFNIPKSEKIKDFERHSSSKHLIQNFDASKVNQASSQIVKETFRISSFDIQPNPKWKEAMGLEHKKGINKSVDEIDYQSIVITSELKVIIDNIQQYKVNYLSRSNILEVIRTMERKNQIKFNKILEETCGLLMKMPEIFLIDFYYYLDRLISAQPPSLETKEIRNEELNFCYNVRLLNDIGKYLKACFEVYTIVVKQVDDVLIPKKEFNILCEYFERSRFNLSLLTMTTKNAIKNMMFDLNIVTRLRNCSTDRGRPSIIDFESERISQVSNDRDNVTKKIHLEITEKMKKQFNFKSTEETQKSSRLKNILSTTANTGNKSKNKKFIKSILNSDLVTKLLHYCSNDIKDKIMSERIIIRYKDKEKQFNEK